MYHSQFIIAFLLVTTFSPFILHAGNVSKEQCQDSIKQWKAMNIYSSLPNTVGSNVQLQQFICGANQQLSACCNVEQETQMLSLSTQKVEYFYRKGLDGVTDTFSRDALAMNSFYKSNVDTTRENLHIMFSKTYGYQYNSNKEFFFTFFNELQDYLDGRRSQIALLLEAFFNQLRERMVRLMLLEPQSPAYPEAQLLCVVQKLKEQQAFGTGPATIQNQMLKTYPIARMFVNALNLGAEVMANVLQKTDVLRQCAAHHMRLQHCPSCYGVSMTAVCHDYCIAIMSHCLAPYKSLAQMWPVFSKTLKSAAEKMEQSVNLPSVNEPLQVQISEAIMELHTALPKKKAELLQQCSNAGGGGGSNINNNINPFQNGGGNAFNNLPRSSYNNRIRRFVPAANQFNINNGRPFDPNAWQPSGENDNNFYNSLNGLNNNMNNNNNVNKPDNNLMRGQSASLALNKLLQQVKVEISYYDKLWDADMGICEDSVFGVSTMPQPPCWNGSDIAEFRLSEFDVSSLPTTTTSKVHADVLMRESKRLQEMTAKLTLALQDRDPDYMPLDGTVAFGGNPGNGMSMPGGGGVGGGQPWLNPDQNSFFPPQLPPDFPQFPPTNPNGGAPLPNPNPNNNKGKKNKNGKDKKKGNNQVQPPPDQLTNEGSGQSPQYPWSPQQPQQPKQPWENPNWVQPVVTWPPQPVNPAPTPANRPGLPPPNLLPSPRTDLEGSGQVPPAGPDNNNNKPPIFKPDPRLPIMPPPAGQPGEGILKPPVDDEDTQSTLPPPRPLPPQKGLKPISPDDNIFPPQAPEGSGDPAAGGTPTVPSTVPLPSKPPVDKGHLHVDLSNIDELMIHIKDMDVPIPDGIWLPHDDTAPMLHRVSGSMMMQAQAAAYKEERSNHASSAALHVQLLVVFACLLFNFII